jgi:N-acetyl sugar amidotransferase
MDTTDPQIDFDDHGVCNHCRNYYKESHIFFASPEEKREALENIVAEIKETGKHLNYDCVIGVSGGVDSTYVAYKVKELGLRPLAVHMDNGWNSELAVKNIENTVKKLQIDLHTHVIDWEEFRDLQMSFLKASVVDIEMLTDHALQAALFNTAVKNKIKYIVWGTNYATESIMPRSWNHLKIDLKNINAIHRKFGTKSIDTFPQISLMRWLYYNYILKVKSVSLLDYLKYDKREAMDLLKEKLCWKEYEYKHDESVFTKFYQDFILPRKFNIDKRRAHYSSMLNSGQIKRDEAIELLAAEDPLLSKSTLEVKSYFLKKMGLSEVEFEELLSLPVKKHADYPNDNQLYRKLTGFRAIIKRLL